MYCCEKRGDQLVVCPFKIRMLAFTFILRSWILVQARRQDFEGGGSDLEGVQGPVGENVGGGIPRCGLFCNLRHILTEKMPFIKVLSYPLLVLSLQDRKMQLL